MRDQDLADDRRSQLTNPVAGTTNPPPPFDPLWDYNWNPDAPQDVHMTPNGNSMPELDFYPEPEGSGAFNTAYMESVSASGGPQQADLSDEVYNAMVSFMRSTAGRAN